MNPQHTVPTMKDGDLILTESRSMAVYLVEKYGRKGQDSLYPEDVKIRARINQRIAFDATTFGPTLIKAFVRISISI